MLVLTRKSNQSIMIGDEIEVSVLSVMGEKVRIGIQAPQSIPVFRKEIYLEIHREAAAAPVGGSPGQARGDLEEPRPGPARGGLRAPRLRGAAARCSTHLTGGGARRSLDGPFSRAAGTACGT